MIEGLQMQLTVNVLTVVGARPQFVKAAALSHAFRSYNSRNSQIDFNEKIVHTGQHYDEAMSDVFFRELDIPTPWRNLEVGSGSHGMQTAQIMQRFEKCLLDSPCDLVVVFGDTNSTIASALVAAKQHIPVAHIEAGLRSFNRQMPEEVNRVVTDHVAELHFCPSAAAAMHLRQEGVTANVFVCGDIMRDAIHNATERVVGNNLSDSVSIGGHFAIATVHRAENTDHPDRLLAIIEALDSLTIPVVLPLHPRTKRMLKMHNISTGSIHTTEPMPYLQMIAMQKAAKLILTDSGGVQKEAYWLKTPCITMRDETEWTELVERGVNIVTGADQVQIAIATAKFLGEDFTFTDDEDVYGTVGAAGRIVDELAHQFLTKCNPIHPAIIS